MPRSPVRGPRRIALRLEAGSHPAFAKSGQEPDIMEFGLSNVSAMRLQSRSRKLRPSGQQQTQPASVPSTVRILPGIQHQSQLVFLQVILPDLRDLPPKKMTGV